MKRDPALILLSCLLNGSEVVVDGHRYRMGDDFDLATYAGSKSIKAWGDKDTGLREEVWTNTGISLSGFISLARMATGEEVVQAAANSAIKLIKEGKA